MALAGGAILDVVGHRPPPCVEGVRCAALGRAEPRDPIIPFRPSSAPTPGGSVRYVRLADIRNNLYHYG
jgi:hypothetical protein